MKETQATIWDWRLKTFGEPTSLFRLATRANEEMAELMRKVAVGTHSPVEIAEEAADVAIVLYGLAEPSGIVVGTLPGRMAFVVPSRQSAAAANRELADILTDIAWGRPVYGSPVREIFEHLANLCHAVNEDLGAAIDAKMAINRAREWKLDGTGHGYHVREKAGA